MSRNPIDRIDLYVTDEIGIGHWAHITVGRGRIRPLSGQRIRGYIDVSPASVRRAQRAQLKLLEVDIEQP